MFLAEQVALCQTNKLALIAIATCFSVRYAINLASFKKLDLKQKKKKESTFVWKTAVDDFKRAVRTIRQDDSNFVHTGHRTMVSFLRYFLSDLVMRGSVPSILHRLRRLPIRIPVISKNETKKKQKKKQEMVNNPFKQHEKDLVINLMTRRDYRPDTILKQLLPKTK